jgi:hypothetical protein
MMETDLTPTERAAGEELADLLARESFFRELPEIDQQARTVEAAYETRLAAAVQARSDVYRQALAQLRGTPGWDQLTDNQQTSVSERLAQRAEPPPGSDASIPLLREETANCPQALTKATEEMLRMIDGNRVVGVDVASYFAGGIENDEQLEAALDGLREKVAALIAAGKKVFVS